MKLCFWVKIHPPLQPNIPNFGFTVYQRTLPMPSVYVHAIETASRFPTECCLGGRMTASTNAAISRWHPAGCQSWISAAVQLNFIIKLENGWELQYAETDESFAGCDSLLEGFCRPETRTTKSEHNMLSCFLRRSCASKSHSTNRPVGN